ncbi:MAG: CC0125/CC1285 family lipoprotein [Rubrimonas sp.]
MRSGVNRRLAAAMLVALAAGACAAPHVYGPADGRGPGYAERRLDDRRFRILYAGDARTSRDQVEAWLLRRAAEVTLAEGHDWFEVLRQDADAETTYRGAGVGAGLGLGVGVGSRSRIGWGLGLGGDAVPITRWRAFADIAMHRGPAPARAGAWQARDVLLTIRP